MAYGSNRRNSGKRLKALLLSSAPLLALGFGIGAASAQTTPDQENGIETVVVTGARAAVQGALDFKKDADKIQDSIVAEDIGKLPDSTVVESLQHVTGISILRTSYEPSTVLIRGLPDIQTLLNGRQVFTGVGRTISLPDFPSELLARVDVQKASSPDQIEGGMAGTVDVRLHRPFDFDGFQFSATAQAGYPSLAGVISPAASALISDRWNTDIGEFGAMLDISWKDDWSGENDIGPGSRVGVTAGPVAGAGSGPATVCTLVTTATSGCLANNDTNAGGVRQGYAARFGASSDQRNGQVERGAMDLALQWRPQQGLELYSEFFYTRLRNRVNTDFFVGQNGNCDDSARDTVFAGTNVLQQEYAGCFGITSNQPFHGKEDTWQEAVGGTWDPTSRLEVTFNVDADVSRNYTQTPVLDDYYNYNEPDGLHTIASYNGTGITLLDMPGNEEVNGPFYYSQLYDNWNDGRGSAYDVQFDANYDFGDTSFIRGIKVGYRYNRRASHQYADANAGLGCAAITTPGNGSLAYNNYYIDAYNSPACTDFRNQATPNFAATVNSNNFSPTAVLAQTNVHVGGLMIPTADLHCTHGDLFGSEFGMTKFCDAATNYLFYDTEQVRNAFGYSGQPPSIKSQEYEVSEDTNDGYLMVNYGFPVFDIPVDGNFGARIADTVLTINSFTSEYVPADPTVGPTVGANAACLTCVVFTPISEVKETFDLLPSFNLKADIMDNLFFRFGASKTLTRPTFGQLNPDLKITAATGNVTGSISGGNPNLTPEKSVNLDADVEYYWGNADHVSFALFHKDVTGYIESITQVFLSGVSYNQSLPSNQIDQSVQGGELAYSQFLDFLPELVGGPDWLGGFGWDVNGTYVAGAFNNINHWHSNVTGIYEYGPVDFRISWTWSSRYLTGPGIGPQPIDNFVAPRNNLDASFNYTYNEHLIFTLDATNISNSHLRSFATQPGDNTSYDENIFTSGVSEFDRVISIGLRYKM